MTGDRHGRSGSPPARALEVTWTVQAPADGVSGTVEVPINGRLPRTARRDRYVAASQATLWVTPPPLDREPSTSPTSTGCEQRNGYGPVERDQSNGQAAGGDGRPIEIDDVTYAKGIGMHATGSLTAWLGGTCSAFDAVVGIDDEVLETPGESGVGSVRFRVYGDGELLAETPVLTNDDGGVPLDRRRHRACSGCGSSPTRRTNGKNFDHADWADAKLTCSAG